MQNIIVGRYGESKAGYLGWLEPEDRTWIMFVRDDGTPQVFLDRDSRTGAVMARDAYVPYPGWQQPEGPMDQA